jgi:hypothetical protein
MTAGWHRAGVAIAAVVGLLLVVGASARDPLGGVAPSPEVVAWPLLVLAGVGLVVVCALLFSMRSSLLPIGPPERARVLRPLPLILASPVLVATLFAIYNSPGIHGRHQTAPALPDFKTHQPRRPAADEPGKSAGNGAAAFASGIAAGVLGLAAFAAVRARRREEMPEDPRAAVAAGARDALEAIAIPADPRAAVLAAYARMEAALAGVGLARRPSEAPREYLTRLEAVLGGGRAPAARLTGLFERARFSTHPIGEDVRRDALGALDALRADLEAPA